MVSYPLSRPKSSPTPTSVSPLPTPQVLPTVQPEEFLPPLSRWVKFGGLIIVSTFSLAIAYSAIAQYKVTVKGQAVIRPTGELRIVQAAAEGKVLQIAVTENQTVRKGDLIATIDGSQLQTKRQQLQTSIQQAQLQVLQINAQIRATATQIAAEANRSDRAIASSEAELTKQLREHHDRQLTAIAKVEEAAAKLRAAEAGLKTAKVRWARYAPLAESGALSKDKLEEAVLDVQQQEQEVAAAVAGVQQAQTAVNPSDAEVAIASAQIGQARASGQGAIANLTKEQEALVQQRIQIQEKAVRDQQDLQQVETDLSRTQITATTDGIIAKLNLRNADQTVAAGQEIAKIVPSHAKLMIKVSIGSQDVDKVKIGQQTQLRVSACPYTDYGTLKGTVKTISPDAIAPPAQKDPSDQTPTPGQAGGSAAPIYEVMVEPQSLALKQRSKACKIQPGMEGRIDIISKQETVLQWLLRKARFMADL
jgi:HlyD family type I secretion membrane fusion protein